ncbi:LemA family protein [bacterium]|nr:LemA family protein [bacterium]
MILFGFLIILILIISPVIIYIVLRNSLINKKNQVENAFAGMDTMLKKRYDLIPNLVAAVKNYMKHEEKVLLEVTELRAKATQGMLTDDQKIDLDNRISKLLSNILVAVEAYPDLKASQNFLQLQAALNEVEEQISASRRAYNAMVTDYNNAVEMFPTSVIANMMKYQRKPLFEIPEAERKNVDVGKLFKE